MRELSFGLSHYLALGLFALTSYIFGRRLLLKLKFESIWEQISFSIGLGMGIVGYLVFFLGILGFLYPSILLLVILACLLGCHPVWLPWFESVNTLCGKFRSMNYVSLLLIAIASLVILLILLPLFPLSLYPPTAFDATMYHLPYAKIYLQNHQIVLTPYLRFPVFPQINEMLFTLMLMYDDIAAQLTQFLMMLLVAVALYAWGHRTFSSRVGLWASALWLGNPIVILLGAWAYIDIGLTLFVTLAAYAFFNWVSSKGRSWLVLAGIFSGLAIGSKYSAFFFLAAFGFAALYVSVRERRWTSPVVFGIIAVCVAAPWFLRNCYYTGNPVFPFFGQIFGNSLWSPNDLLELLREMKSHGTGQTLSSLVFLPWNLTFKPIIFNEYSSLSPVYFLTLPIVLLFGFRNIYLRGLLILTFAYTVFWFFSVQIMRYLVPILPILSLATAGSLGSFLSWLAFLRKWPRQELITAFGLVVLIWPGWFYAVDKVRHQGSVPVTQEQRDAYLAAQFSSYSVYKFLNELQGKDYALYALYDENMAYFADGKFMGDWFGPGRFYAIESELTDGQALYRKLRALGANYFLVANRFGRVNLPQDTFFFGHFKLIYSRAYASLFELTEGPLRRTIGPQLLQNHDFEDVNGLSLSSWAHASNIVIDPSGQNSYSGLVAVRIDADKNPINQAVQVNPTGHYVLSFYSRIMRQGQRVRIQVNWADDAGMPLWTDGKEKRLITDSVVFEVDQIWKHYEMTLTAPEEAGFAIIYASPHETGSAWFDDFSFKEITFKNGQ